MSLSSKFSSELIDTMADADEEILMSNLRYLLREMWRKNIYLSWFYAAINWLATLLFFIATVFYQQNFWYMVFSSICFFLLLAFELIVALKDCKRYLKSKYNYVDITQYVVMPIIMFLNFFEIFDDKKQWYNLVISVTMVVAAGRSLTMFRVVDGVRYLVAMILQVFLDMRFFMCILVGSILSFALIELEVMKTVAPKQNDDGTFEEKTEFYTIKNYFFLLMRFII